MSITQTFHLNLIPEQGPTVVHCDQYDEGTGRLIIKLYDGDVAYSPSGTATIQGKKPDGHGFEYAATLVGNTVTADLTKQMTAVAGPVRCQVVVRESDDRTGTFVFILQVQKSALPDDTEMSASDYQLIEQAFESAEDAEAWAVGERGGVPVDPSDPTYHNNSYYWAGQAAIYAQGALRFQGSIPFASIPTTGQVGGDMYNITDDFTTDARFMEGAGKFCPAGTNIAWVAASSKWDVLSIMKIGSLDDLTDVSITSPLSGDDYLGYNPVSQEFENKKLTEMSNLTKGIGRPDGKTTDVSLGVFSAIGVNIPAEVNSGGTQYGANWLYYAGTTEVITPDADQNYRVTNNGTTKLYFWNGSTYEELTSGGGGGTGDYMGLYGMTEIQSSDGQASTPIDLDAYTTIGNYYCDEKGQISLDILSYINGPRNQYFTTTKSGAEFLLYVRTLPNGDHIQTIYLDNYSDSSSYIVAERRSYMFNGNRVWTHWAMYPSERQSSSGTDVNMPLGGLNNVTLSSVANGDALIYDSSATKWKNKPINKVTTLSVDLTGWTSDTTSQSGTTLYKKQMSLNHVYVESPTVDIGASGVLPTVAEQESYNLLQYVTVDDSVPCLYLYASAIPTTAFYINVTGVD